MDRLASKLTKRLEVEKFAVVVRSLAESGEKTTWEEFQTRIVRQACSDLLDEEGYFTGEFEDLGQPEDAIETDEVNWHMEDLLKLGSSRYVRLSYNDMHGTDLFLRLVPFSPDSGAVLTIYAPDVVQPEVSAQPVSGDLEDGFQAACRKKIEPGFQNGMWTQADAEFSSGVTLVNDEAYPIQDQAFWDQLLAESE